MCNVAGPYLLLGLDHLSMAQNEAWLRSAAASGSAGILRQRVRADRDAWLAGRALNLPAQVNLSENLEGLITPP